MTIAQTRESARIFAIKLGFSYEADDLAQAAMIKLIERPKQRISQAVIDAVRDWRGAAPRKSKSSNPRGSYGSAKSGPDLATQLHDVHPAPDTVIDHGHGELPLEYIQALDKADLDPIDRAVFVLWFGWDLTETEISKCFAATPSSISKRLALASAEIAAVMLTPKKSANRI